MREVRCDKKLHGIIVKPGILEVRCDSRFCGAGRGVVVLHRFDVHTGEMTGTKRYKQPERRQHP